MGRSNKSILVRQLRAQKELNRRKAQNDFWAFCLYVDSEFFNKRPFLKLIANAFMRVYNATLLGVIYKISVSMPPRAGKSYITSLFAAWMLAKFPAESIMRNCCSATLYQKFSYDTRDIIRSAIFREVFPHINLQYDKQNVNGWSLETARQVSYYGAGVSGTIIGFGTSLLAITDDLYKSFEEALSETINEKTWRWKEGAHDSRIERNCCSIDIGTRWSVNDVIGRLEAREDYDEIIRVPALNERGESFCDDVHTSEYYKELERTLDPVIWLAEYQQQPIEAEGLLFPHKELKWFVLDEIKGKSPDGIIGACDVADKGNDDFAAPLAKIYSDRFFVTDVVFTKDPVEVTECRLAQMIIDTNCDTIRIESNNGGRIFANSVKKLLKDKSTCEVKTRHTSRNKETRILMKSGFVKSHLYFRNDYEKGSDYDRFIQGLTSYLRTGDNKHDDAPDSVTILAEFIEKLGIMQGKFKAPVDRSAYGFY